MTPLVTAVLTALLAGVLTPLAQRVTDTPSRWLRWRTHVPLAAVGGAGAAVLADSWAELITFAALAVGAAVLVVVDLSVHRLPDRIVGPLYPVLFAGLTVAAAVDGYWSSLGRAALAALVLLVGYFVLAFLSPSGLGLGDVKLSGLVGGFLGWLGWAHVLTGTLAAFVIGGLVAAVLLVIGRAGRHSDIAFGPWMMAGAVVGAAWGPLLVG
ncbi:A24 family peptidase [Georgenia sp. 10Sc9-8]|uniref:A24 family peptidase n=1 Tax=Georgenia halotolerans TaxID=3028317 RepID=A0ABT5TXE6_9MICO|nr:A24 family peptidase [Georgenia halotolerans]